MKRGFTLIELLVVLSIIALLLGILLPSLSRVREQARIVAVNAELYQITLALELYYEDNHKYPPTQEDCITGKLTDHLYQLPKVLAAEKYLPTTARQNPMSTTMEDRYNRGHTYKYRSLGEVIKDRNIIDKWIKARLWIPDGFPAKSSLDPSKGRWYPNPSCPYPSQAPVRWVVFSLGPRFDEKWLNEKLNYENRYPIPKELWYSSERRKGFIVRMRLKNGTYIGSFEGNP